MGSMLGRMLSCCCWMSHTWTCRNTHNQGRSTHAHASDTARASDPEQQAQHWFEPHSTLAGQGSAAAQAVLQACNRATQGLAASSQAQRPQLIVPLALSTCSTGQLRRLSCKPATCCLRPGNFQSSTETQTHHAIPTAFLQLPWWALASIQPKQQLFSALHKES
jgi:hypothetical protein